MRSSIQELIN